MNAYKNLMESISSQVSLFTNISFIYDKITKDGYVEELLKFLRKVMENEINFTIIELKKIDSKEPDFDVKD